MKITVPLPLPRGAVPAEAEGKNTKKKHTAPYGDDAKSTVPNAARHARKKNYRDCHIATVKGLYAHTVKWEAPFMGSPLPGHGGRVGLADWRPGLALSSRAGRFEVMRGRGTAHLEGKQPFPRPSYPR